jgi:hypothetical protein
MYILAKGAIGETGDLRSSEDRLRYLTLLLPLHGQLPNDTDPSCIKINGSTFTKFVLSRHKEHTYHQVIMNTPTAHPSTYRSVSVANKLSIPTQPTNRKPTANPLAQLLSSWSNSPPPSTVLHSTYPAMSSKPGFRNRTKQWLKSSLSPRSRSKSSNRSSVTPRGPLPAPGGAASGTSALANEPDSTSAPADPSANVTFSPTPQTGPTVVFVPRIQSQPITPAADGDTRDGIGKTIASFRTLLNISEKALEGLPLYGPKAAVGALGEALRVVEVGLL